MHPELRRGLAEEHVRALTRDGAGAPSPGSIRRFVSRFASRRPTDQASNASLTSVSASSTVTSGTEPGPAAA